jgi:hypothetical protein
MSQGVVARGAVPHLRGSARMVPDRIRYRGLFGRRRCYCARRAQEGGKPLGPFRGIQVLPTLARRGGGGEPVPLGVGGREPVKPGEQVAGRIAPGEWGPQLADEQAFPHEGVDELLEARPGVSGTPHPRPGTGGAHG